MTALFVVATRGLQQKRSLRDIAGAIREERADPHPRKSRASSEFWGDAVGAYAGSFLAYAVAVTGYEVLGHDVLEGRWAFALSHVPLVFLTGGAFAAAYMYLAIGKRRVDPSLRTTDTAYVVGSVASVVMGLVLWQVR